MAVRHTYSVVHIWRDVYTGRLYHTCPYGCMTFATLERAYAYVMRRRATYTPGDKRDYLEVRENYFAGDEARRAMGWWECSIYDALSNPL